MAKFPEEYKFPFFCCAAWKRSNSYDYHGSGFWFRIFWGSGLHFTNGMLSFSERNGYKKFYKLPFGWRFTLLKKERKK